MEAEAMLALHHFTLQVSCHKVLRTATQVTHSNIGAKTHTTAKAVLATDAIFPSTSLRVSSIADHVKVIYVSNVDQSDCRCIDISKK